MQTEPANVGTARWNRASSARELAPAVGTLLTLGRPLWSSQGAAAPYTALRWKPGRLALGGIRPPSVLCGFFQPCIFMGFLNTILSCLPYVKFHTN